MRHHRLARFVGILSIGVAMLTALSLVFNHIELSLSIPRDPPNAGNGSIDSTHLQTGFRNARVYFECVQWKRLSHELSYNLASTYRATGWEWLGHVATKDDPVLQEFELAVNGWLCAAALGIYPAWVIAAAIIRRLRGNTLRGCIRCGYDLTGNVSGACPECGAEVLTRPTGMSHSSASANS
jgi:hypothetical protein